MSETERQQSRTKFRHEQIDANPPCSRLGFCLTTDLTGNGLPDVIVGGAGQGFPGRDFVAQLDRDTPLPVEAMLDLVGVEHTNLFWYENPGWERHDVAFAPNLDVGATLCDVTGDGRQNVVVGQGINNTDVYWFEMPDDPREPWTPHLVTDTFEKYHDLAAGDVDGDGVDELVGLSQESETVFYYDIPEDPTVEPWPESCLHIVDRGIEIEGLRIRDIDHDGQHEIIAGTYVYHRDSGAATGWRRDPVVTGWDDTRVELADLDGDGDLEVIFSEGDSPTTVPILAASRSSTGRSGPEQSSKTVSFAPTRCRSRTSTATGPPTYTSPRWGWARTTTRSTSCSGTAATGPSTGKSCPGASRPTRPSPST